MIKENKLQEVIGRGAQAYGTEFADIFESVEANSSLAKRTGFGLYEQYALGKQLAQTKDYLAFYMNESGGTGDLGVLPNIALDLVTMQYTNGIMPLIASVQPLDDEQGTVYFKTFRAETSKAGATAGETIFGSPLGKPDSPSGFTGEQMTQKIADLADATLGYTLDAGSAPDQVRPNTVRVTLSNNPAVSGIDDGQGNIKGVGMMGTVDYATGAIDITLAANPGAGGTLDYVYGVDFGEGATLPKMSRIIQSKRVIAQIYALATQVSLFQNYAMHKRFGSQSEDELITDLSNLINADLGNSMLSRAYNAVPTANEATWDSTNPNLSATDRAYDLKRYLSILDAKIVDNLGYGHCSWYSVDAMTSTWIRLVQGFEGVPASVEVGPQLIGYLEGKPVIMWPYQNPNTILGGFKGSTPFSAALVYAPYMPIVTTSALPGSNEVTQRGMAATWAYTGTLLNTSEDPQAECKGLAKLTITAS